ncbi:MAG TPA: sigma 54-interacting transcriptional regulator, partial [Syntrophomonas sp.]|nr:sigma 54-interacting transcriptional regulator [Syntrophomonas sp.]
MANFTISEFLEMLEPLIASPYMAVVVVDRKGFITDINQTYLELLETTEEAVIGQYILDVLPNSELIEVMETGRIDRADIWSIRGVSAIATRFPLIKNGQIIGAVGQSFILDMSGTSVLASRLEETEKEFSAVVEAFLKNPYTALVMVDNQGRITAMNQCFLDGLELTKEAVLGNYVCDIIPNSKFIDVLRTGQTDKIVAMKFNGRDALVTRIPIMKNGQITGALAQVILLDMSGAHILMQRLQEREKDFAAISEALIEGQNMIYVIVDKDGIITAINQAYLDELGIEKEAAMGHHILDVTPNSHLPEILKTGRTDKADLWTINGRDTVITRLPIIKDGQIIGAIAKSLFLDMSGAQILIKKLQETQKELNIYKEELRQSYQARWYFDDLIGKDNEFIKVKSLAYHLSKTVSNILITGESGTGKELFAHAIHNASPRYLAPFVRINCAALPESLLESELFGYEEGAFTGARKGGKPGKFELAKGGTIFLDEIGDMPLTMQTKLLLVLQERVVERVGGTQLIPTNVRVIAATNRDLESMVVNKEFRQDLYYRLNVVNLKIPPLRERIADIPIIINELMHR